MNLKLQGLFSIWLFVFWLGSLSVSPSSARLLQKRQTINETQSQIGDIIRLLGPRKQVDLVVVLHRSQGIGKRSFYTAIRPLIESIMVQYATIHPEYVRTAAVTFAEKATVDYDQISEGWKAETKCQLFAGNDSVWNKVVFRNELMSGANVSDGFYKAIDILRRGKLNRPSATQVLIVVTDGDYSTSDDPLKPQGILQGPTMNVTMFSVGLGSWFKPGSVRALASNPSYYGELEKHWNVLLKTNLSSVGSDVSPFWSRVNDTVCDYFGANCLDENSACYCDVDTGSSECRCQAGFYQQQQQQQQVIQCQACPLDSYRGELDDDLSCRPCSPGFGTEPAINGSTTPAIGCQCKDNCTSDPCNGTNNPCGVNEVCSVDPSTGGPSCTCRKGFTGPNCTVNQDDCSASSTQCLNGAMCYDKVNGVQCVCALGFRGPNCEVDARDCLFDICVANHTQSCQDNGNNFHCNCVYGWIGDFCENVDPNTTPLSTTTTSTTSFSPPSSSSAPSTSNTSSSSDSSSSSPSASFSISASPTTPIDSNSASTPNATGLNDTGLTPPSLVLGRTDNNGRSEQTILIIIIVCVVGGALLLLLLILIVVIVMSRRRRRRRLEEEKKKAASAGRVESFQTPRHFGVRSTKNRLSRTISDRFSGLWKKWTVRANDPSDWYNNAGVPSVPKQRPGLQNVSDPRSVDLEEAVVTNDEIFVDGRLSGWNSYLKDLEKSGILESGVIAQTDTQEFAKTDSWVLDWTELEEVETMISSHEANQSVSIQGTKFEIETNDGVFARGSSDEGTLKKKKGGDGGSASSSSSSSSRGGRRTVAVGATKCYLIVGVTRQDDDEAFHKEIQWVVDHITAEGY